jgi:small subunit ribosomal protein S7
MPRRREIPKREILPDPKYSSGDVAKFVNVLMSEGKKSVAERIVYGAFESIAKKGGKDPLEVFTQALSNAKPMVEVKSRRVGGANFQVPVEVRPVRRVALAARGRAQAWREVDGPTARRGAARGVRRARRRGQETRGSAPDGRGEQGLLALQILRAGRASSVERRA